MLWIGTVTTPLQIGHGADMLIWSGVAERCWPHVGHANRNERGIPIRVGKTIRGVTRYRDMRCV